ncbi:MAG: polysaccharide deacetylase family protein [Actinomycetes bacterium]
MVQEPAASKRRRLDAPSAHRLGRRDFLWLAAGGLLAACSSPGGSPQEVAVPTSPHPSATAAPGTQLSSPDPAPTGTPSPAREEIVARYTGVSPAAWGLAVPGVVQVLPTTERVVALTFDACGGPSGSGYDAALIETLVATGTPATLFLNQRWILTHPGIAAELASEPLFELANHGTLHRPLSVDGESAYGIAGTAGPGEAYDEVVGNRRTLTELTGAPPRFFRSGTAHYDDVAVRMVGDIGETVVNFDVNGDAGATFGPQQVAAALQSCRAGSIVIGHMNQPAGGTAEGVAAALPRLADDGFRCVRLSEHLA